MSVEGGTCIPIEEHKRLLAEARASEAAAHAEVARLRMLLGTWGDLRGEMSPLGPEFEAVWDANVRTLYERDDIQNDRMSGVIRPEDDRAQREKRP